MTWRDDRAGSAFFNNAPLVIGVLLVVDSLHFVFARLLAPHLPGVTSAFYVLGVAALEVTIFLAIRRSIKPRVFFQNTWFFLAIGFLVASSTGINYIAINYIDPGTASMLAQMSTVFALGISVVWLREHLTRIQVMGALLALAGVFLISFQPGDYLRLGSLMVLVSSFMYALHAGIVKRYGGNLEFSNFFLWRVITTASFLFLFTAVSGNLEWPGWEAWIVIITAGTVDVVLSRVLYYVALRRLKMSIHTIILTLSPMLTILWSVILFSEKPSAQAFIGGAAVIAGVLLVTASIDRRR
ncbi:MAG: DMT family transporter [Candidatus Promineifilaceae bacterium]